MLSKQIKKRNYLHEKFMNLLNGCTLTLRILNSGFGGRWEGRIYYLQQVRRTPGIFPKAASWIENSRSPVTHTVSVCFIQTHKHVCSRNFENAISARLPVPFFVVLSSAGDEVNVKRRRLSGAAGSPPCLLPPPLEGGRGGAPAAGLRGRCAPTARAHPPWRPASAPRDPRAGRRVPGPPSLAWDAASVRTLPQPGWLVSRSRRRAPPSHVHPARSVLLPLQHAGVTVPQTPLLPPPRGLRPSVLCAPSAAFTRQTGQGSSPAWAVALVANTGPRGSAAQAAGEPDLVWAAGRICCCLEIRNKHCF